MPLTLFQAGLIATSNSDEDITKKETTAILKEFNEGKDGEASAKSCLAGFVVSSIKAEGPGNIHLHGHTVSSIYVLGVIAGILLERSKHNG